MLEQNFYNWVVELRRKFPELTISSERLKKLKYGILVITYAMKCSLSSNCMMDAFHTTGGCMRNRNDGEPCTDFNTIMGRTYASVSAEEMAHMNLMRPRAIAYARKHGRFINSIHKCVDKNECTYRSPLERVPR